MDRLLKRALAAGMLQVLAGGIVLAQDPANTSESRIAGKSPPKDRLSHLAVASADAPPMPSPRAVLEGSDRFEQKGFLTPANAYRSVPFYSLNDDLDPAEVDRQLHRFKEGGFGGTFLHSRIGLLTEYLSEKWFGVMAAGVKSSQQLGIDAWFYDEDKWPSGFAGGIVPLEGSRLPGAVAGAS